MKKTIYNNRVRWTRITFWILWPIATLILLSVLTMMGGNYQNGNATANQGAALGSLTSAALVAYILVGIPCACTDLIICIYRKRKDLSVQLPIVKLIIPCILLIVIIYAANNLNRHIEKSSHERQNETKISIPIKEKEPEFSQTIADLKEFNSSVIDEMQEQLNDAKLGVKLQSEPHITDPYDKMKNIAESSSGYTGVLLKLSVEGMQEISHLSQEYQKSAGKYTDPTIHDLTHLNECKQSLVQIQSLAEKLSLIFLNYRDYLEKAIPLKPNTSTLNDFDQNKYIIARHAFIESSHQRLTPIYLDYWKTEKEIWNLKIEELELLIKKFDNWDIDSDGITIFENDIDLKEVTSIQSKIKEAANRSLELANKMLNQKRKEIEKW